MKYKYGERVDLFDIKVRNIFVANKVTALTIMCTHRYNHYRVQNEMIKNNIVGVEYPRYSEVDAEKLYFVCENCRLLYL